MVVSLLLAASSALGATKPAPLCKSPSSSAATTTKSLTPAQARSATPKRVELKAPAARTTLCARVADVVDARAERDAETDALKIAKSERRLTEAKADLDALRKLRGEPACDNRCVDELKISCSTVPKSLVSTVPPAIATTAVTAGMSWQTAFVTGLAQFLSDRAQQEVVLWLVEQFQKDLCKSDATKDLFHETCTLLDPDCGYSDLPPGTILAAAIRADIEGLPAAVLTQYAGLKEATAKAIVQIFLEMRSGHPPLELIAGWSEDQGLINSCTREEDNVACSMVLTGALVAQAGDVAVPNPTATIDDAAKAALAEAKSLMERVCNKISVDETKKTCNKFLENLDLPRVKALLRAAAGLAQKLDQVNKSGAPAAEKAADVLGAVKLVIDAGAALMPDDVQLGHGNKELVVVVWRSVDDGIDATTAMLSGRYADGVRSIVALVRDVAGKSLPEPLPRYLVMVVDLSNAKTSSDVQAALQAAAAPVGSWRDKRKACSISVTGLVGVAGGYERPLATDGGKRVGSWSGGLMGAVGFDFAFPMGQTWTHGFFLSVLDVGQLITTPIDPQPGKAATDKSTTMAKAGTDFQLVQVFSPGFYYRFGAGKSPFTLGAGFSVAPQLRVYETTGASAGKDLLSMMRFNAFAAVDVTIFPIYRHSHSP